MQTKATPTTPHKITGENVLSYLIANHHLGSVVGPRHSSSLPYPTFHSVTTNSHNKGHNELIGCHRRAGEIVNYEVFGFREFSNILKMSFNISLLI